MLHPLVLPVVAWFAERARDLPWRAPDRSPWGVLVSEVMLQQTPVARVEPLWRDWMERWPAAADLAAASTADVLRAWGRLGYPRRALRLQECARTVVDRHDGTLPTSEPELLALPGIGTYTAAAVTAFAYGRRAVVVDTNVRRVLARTVDGTALPAPHLSVTELRRAGELVPEEDGLSARWNAAVMELGALVCTARAPRCADCPIAASCAWRLAGMPADELAHRRRVQGFTGTDRQVRGMIMARLREASEPVVGSTLRDLWPEREQLERALAGLVVDGLVARVQGSGADAAPTGNVPSERGAPSATPGLEGAFGLPR